MNDSLQALTFRSFVLFRQQKKKKKHFQDYKVVELFLPLFFISNILGNPFYIGTACIIIIIAGNGWPFCVHHLTLSSISFFIIMDIKKNARHYPILLSLPADRDGRTDGHNGDADGNSESLLLFKKVLTIQIFSVPVKDKEK
jgi:hypothetical protein